MNSKRFKKIEAQLYFFLQYKYEAHSLNLLASFDLPTSFFLLCSPHFNLSKLISYLMSPSCIFFSCCIVPLYVLYYYSLADPRQYLNSCQLTFTFSCVVQQHTSLTNYFFYMLPSHLYLFFNYFKTLFYTVCSINL